MKLGSFLKRGMLVGATCAAMFVAPVSQAGTLEVTSINGEGVNLIGAVTGGTIAGTFSGKFNGDPIYFWCIELLQHINIGGTYTNYTAADFQSSPLAFATANQLKTLFNLFYTVPPTSAHDAAVFQIAIWDIVFDNDYLVATGGAGFGVDPVAGDPNAIANAQTMVDAVFASRDRPFALTQLTNPDLQDFITPKLPGLVPEPAGLALFGAGLIAMMVGMRRRKSGGQSV
jgi:PEP-CTERM motif